MKKQRQLASLLVLALSLSASAADKKPVTGSAAARRLAHAHKVFLGTTGSPSNDINQAFYDQLAADLKTNNGYEMVDDPSQAELILYVSSADWQAYLSLVDPSTHIIVWTLTAELTGWHGTNNTLKWSGSEPKGAKSLSDDLKTLATTTP